MRIALFLALLTPGISAVLEAQDPWTPEEREIFALLDRVDPLDTSTLAFVRVATGWTIRPTWGEDEIEPRNHYELGFLLSEETRSFNVRFVTMSECRFEKTADGTEEGKRVGFERLELAAAARDCIGGIRRQRAESQPSKGDYPPLRWSNLALARACARRGLSDEAHGLIEGARSLRPDQPMLAWLKADLGEYRADEIWDSFAVPSQGRHAILDRIRHHRELFGDAGWERISSLSADLESFAAEDAAWNRGERPKFTSDADRKSAELVHALRDEFMPPHVARTEADEAHVTCAFHVPRMGYDEDPNRPANRLVALGRAAVPCLLKVVDDRRPSRCTYDSWGGSFFTGLRLSVGDLALSIVSVILERRFSHGSEGAAEARAWWKALAERGEESALTEAVMAGNRLSSHCARQLRSRFPDSALKAIMSGARKSLDDWGRDELVSIIAEDRGTTSSAFLSEEMKSAPFLSTRVLAARALRDRGQQDVEDAMLEEWRQLAATVGPSPSFMGMGVENLALFLLGTTRREILQETIAVASRPGSGLRTALIEDFGCDGAMVSSRPTDTRPVETRPGREPGFDELIDRFLFESLEDSTQLTGTTIGSLMQPQVAELAAERLARRHPETLAFDSSLLPTRRARQLVVMRNVWRARVGEPLLPLPDLVPPPPPRLERDVVPPQVEALIGAADSADRVRRVASLLELGLGALPHVEERLTRLEKDHPSRETLARSARQISVTVASTRVAGAVSSLAEPLRQRIHNLSDRPLDVDAMMDAFIELRIHPPPGVGGASLIVERPGDGSGVAVTFELAPGRAGATVEESHCINNGERNSWMSAGGTSGDASAWTKRSDFSELKDLRRAMDSAPSKPFDFRIDIRFR